MGKWISREEILYNEFLAADSTEEYKWLYQKNKYLYKKLPLRCQEQIRRLYRQLLEKERNEE